MSRATKALIAELDSTAGELDLAVLVLAFGNEPRFVRSDDPGRHSALRKHIAAGGEAIGFLLITSDHLTVILRDKYEEAEWAREYLRIVEAEFADRMSQEGHQVGPISMEPEQ